MTKGATTSQRQKTLEEAKAWWEKLTGAEKKDQLKPGKRIDSEKIRLAMHSRLIGWDQVDIVQFQQRIMGKNE